MYQHIIKKVLVTERKSTCHECGDFIKGTAITKGQKRLVLSTGIGRNSRHESLCARCAVSYLKRENNEHKKLIKELLKP